MSKDKIQLFSPLFLKYQSDYEKNPRSRVFAPLAEIYRKLGMTDKAMEILSQGIRFHPMYVMGYLGLAFCYFDLKQYSLAYNTLKPLTDSNRDNIRLQKLFAEICLELGYKEEALDTYKYLLFISPRDREAAAHVSTLESLIEQQYKTVHQPIYIPESEFRNEISSDKRQLFDVDKLENKPHASKADFDDWRAVDLSREQPAIEVNDPYELWSLEKGSLANEDLADDPIHVELDLDDLSLEEEEIEFEARGEVQREIRREEPLPDNTPLVTHTLVDLYCGQGHIEKALEVLEKILILNPTDEKTIKKISEIRSLMEPEEEEEEDSPVLELVTKPKTVSKESITAYSNSSLDEEDEMSEEDGRKNLMSLFDKQVSRPVEVREVKPSKESQKKRLVEEKLNQFLKKIQKRALDYQARV